MKTGTFLVTGGAGFFGGVLKRFLLEKGFSCVSIDLEPDDDSHPRLVSVRGDIRDRDTLDGVFGSAKIDAVFHCATMLAHEIKDRDALWTSNVNGTENIAEMCVKYGVGKVVYTSSNCLWGRDLGGPVTEDEIPEPVEIYGESKLKGEEILLSFSDSFRTVVLRCPTIIDAGRVGLLGILFEFIREGRRVWTVGGGDNRYQFIYAGDLADACLRSLDCDKSDIFNVGSDDVCTLREAYEYVISQAGTSSRVASLPGPPAVFLMKLFHRLKLSPLGPYHYRMISGNFVFDTSKIKRVLGWSPTLDNRRMLLKAYNFYVENCENLKKGGAELSAHRRSSGMGIIRLLKMIS